MIPADLLEKYGALKKSFQKNEVIFEEGKLPTHYYQIISGEVKMSNINEDGREFVQGFFDKDKSFGGPLFINRPYPANAIATENTELYIISKEKFMKLLSENPSVSMEIIEHLAHRLHYKSMVAAEISTHEPEHRVLRLIDYFITYFNFEKTEMGYLIDLTRQQIGDLTGLRVETVIRAIKSLEKKGELKIINRKVYR